MEASEVSALADTSELLTLRGLPPLTYPESSSSLRNVLVWPWETTKGVVARVISPPSMGDVRQAFPWLPPVVERLGTLRGLGPGWDTYGGDPPKFEHLVEAFRFLIGHMRVDTDPPWIVPLGSGGVQLEWHRPDLDIEITFEDDGSEIVIERAGDEVVAPLSEGRLLFTAVLHDLSQQ